MSYRNYNLQYTMASPVPVDVSYRYRPRTEGDLVIHGDGMTVRSETRGACGTHAARGGRAWQLDL